MSFRPVFIALLIGMVIAGLTHWLNPGMSPSFFGNTAMWGAMLWASGATGAHVRCGWLDRLRSTPEAK